MRPIEQYDSQCGLPGACFVSWRHSTVPHFNISSCAERQAFRPSPIRSSDISRVGLADWRNVARICAVEEEGLIGMITEMAGRLTDEVFAVRAHAISDGLSESIIGPL